MMDVVYPYKRTPGDVELRYSLRSLSNMPHSRVIVAGDSPRVKLNVIKVGVARELNRYAASTRNIFEAARQVVETDHFIVMNDDIFVLEPWTFRHEHRCTIEEYLGSDLPKGDYRRHTAKTRDILKAHGVADPLFFGMHTPTVYERSKLIDLVKEFKGKRYLLRTLYHNLFPQPSERREDVKVRTWAGEPIHQDVLSISDGCARDPQFLAWIAARFPDPSPYEAAPRAAVAA